MLILTRRPGESILIDNPTGAIDCAAEPITVTVLGVKGNQVRTDRIYSNAVSPLFTVAYLSSIAMYRVRTLAAAISEEQIEASQ